MAKLFVVGTPIGNMEDITLRAIRTLKEADIIACEDTRHSLPLLSHYGIKAKLVAYHKFNESECSDALIGEISSGKNVALISDAGMPSISDPGATLISKAREAGLQIELVPGPTALASAVTLSGLKSTGFTFLGFLPEKRSDKASIVSSAAMSGLPLVLYVAPHDLSATASFLYELLGDRRAYVCRELTKMHECVTITSLASFDAEERGEIVLIVEGASELDPLNSLPIEEHLKHYLDLGFTKKDAVKQVARDRSVPKNEIYKLTFSSD